MRCGVGDSRPMVARAALRCTKTAEDLSFPRKLPSLASSEVAPMFALAFAFSAKELQRTVVDARLHALWQATDNAFVDSGGPS
jgi:hypothetical protein